MNGEIFLSECRFFIDFDNTVTLGDVLNDMIRRFSVGDDWVDLEKYWLLGEITTIKCLTGQMKGIRITQKQLNQYLKTVQIDPYFSKLVDFLRKKGVSPVILSDNFEPFIKAILENNRIEGIKVFANHIKFHKDQPIPSFPYRNPNCPFCAHCKKIHLREGHCLSKTKIIYIGDGRSDFCPAMEADLVFAKDALLKYMLKKKRPCIEFRGLDDVYGYLGRSEPLVVPDRIAHPLAK